MSQYSTESYRGRISIIFFFFQAEDGIRDFHVTGVQTCALPISASLPWQGRHGSDAALPRQELGRGRRPDRARVSRLVRERPIDERLARRDAGARRPIAAAHPAGALRPEPGVPDVPAPPPSPGGEASR